MLRFEVISIFPSPVLVVIAFITITIVNKLSILVVFKLCCPLLFEALKVRIAECGPLCIIHVAHGSLESFFLSCLVNLRSHKLLVALVTLLRVGVCLFLCFGLGSYLLFNIK